MAPPGGGSGGGSGGGGGGLTDAELTRRARALKSYKEALQETSDASANFSQVTEAGAVSQKKFAALTNEGRAAILEQRKAALEMARAYDGSSAAISRLKNEIKQLEAATSGFVDIAGAMHQRVNGLMGITDAWKTDLLALTMVGGDMGQSFTSNLEKISKAANTAEGKQKRMGANWQKVSEGMNAGFYAIVSQTMKLANGLDQAMVSFRKAHGASDQFVKAIPALEEKFYKLGISAEQAAQVMGSLYSSMTGFTRLAPDGQKAAREMATVLESLGVDAAASAQNMEILNRSMGFSGQQAANITGQLFSLAQKLDISTSKMMEDFTRLGPQLTVYGSQAVNVFVRLEAAAKESGIQVERLLSIASKFDTFKGAAESVGQLNAVLGGPYLSVMKMVQQTDPSERMKMLAQATQQAGLSFDQMSYYQRKAVAEAAGLQDVNELALVMKNRWDLVGDSVKMNANQIEKLAEENKKYKTVQQDLQAVLRQLAVPATQILTLFKSIAEIFLAHPGIIKVLIPLFISFKMAMLGLQVASMAAASGMVAAKAAMLGMTVGIGGAILALTGLAYVMLRKKSSPVLFGPGSGMQMAAQQTAALGSSLGFVGTQAKAMSPHLKQLSSDIKSLPDSKMIHIKKVFNAEEGVLNASKGANITAHTVRLLGAATAGSAGGQTIQNHMDVTVEMDGSVIGHRVAKQLSDRG
jgi:hypothetical protein